MIIRVNPADPRPIYTQITDEVRRCLVIGTLAAEDALPSVRELAADLRVNPNTVQQAYRELERAGLVYVRRGKGTFVSGDAVGDVDKERERIASEVAARALSDAYRHGVDADALMDAIREERKK